MNKIKGLEALAGLRAKLPLHRGAKPAAAPPEAPQTPQESVQQPVSAREADAYASAFDALLTLWQVSGSHRAALPPAVQKAWSVASMKLRPIFDEATNPGERMAS